MPTPLQVLEESLNALQDQINQIDLACQTEQQRQDLGVQYTQARRNYWDCMRRSFAENDALVASLTGQIDAANQQLRQSVTQLNDIAQTLNTIATAVTLGTQLASKVLPL